MPTSNSTNTLARGMESAASSLHERADRLPGGEKIVGAAHTAADAMQSAADYVREQDLREMLAELRARVKRHPGATLLAATALGFVLARALSRRV